MLFLVALSCSTACLTMSAVDAVAERKRRTEYETKVLRPIEDRLRPLLPPNVHGTLENERLRVTGGSAAISIRVVGTFTADDRARLENAAHELYGSVVSPPTRLVIVYLDDATSPPSPAGRVVLDGPAPAATAAQPQR